MRHLISELQRNTDPYLHAVTTQKICLELFQLQKFLGKETIKWYRCSKIFLQLWKKRASKYCENTNIHIFPSRLLTCLIFQLSFQRRRSHDNENHRSGILPRVYTSFLVFVFLFSYVKWVIDTHIAYNAILLDEKSYISKSFLWRCRLAKWINFHS